MTQRSEEPVGECVFWTTQNYQSSLSAPYCREKLINKYYVSACSNVTSVLYLESVPPDDQQGALFDRKETKFLFSKHPK